MLKLQVFVVLVLLATTAGGLALIVRILLNRGRPLLLYVVVGASLLLVCLVVLQFIGS